MSRWGTSVPPRRPLSGLSTVLLTFDIEPAGQGLAPPPGDAAGVEPPVGPRGSGEGQLSRGAVGDEAAVLVEVEAEAGGGRLGRAAQSHGGPLRHGEGRTLQQHGAVFR